MIRFSAIPSHFSTAVFSTCGVRFRSFAFATFVTLPKQIFLVYLGVLLLQDKPDHSAKNILFGVAFAVTIVMAGYIWYKMRAIKKVLLAEQAARKEARLREAGGVSGVDGEEGRPWLMETAPPVAQPGGQREYAAVAQEEADIGVPGAGGYASPGEEPLGPRYRPEYGYQGLGISEMGREPVKEQTWV